jgi:hypothetical protein
MEKFLFHEIPTVMSERDFSALLEKFKDPTAPRYYIRAKQLIMRGLLTSGCDAKQCIDPRKELVAGALKLGGRNSVSRIFIVTGNNQAELVWEGPSKEFRKHYQMLRDLHCGYV